MPRSSGGGGGRSKKTPGSGVVAPGFKPVRKGGKIVPKPKSPKKSPIFGPLPKPKQQVPGAGKVRPRGTRNVTVQRTGQIKTSKPAKGTEAYRSAKRRRDSLYGSTRKILEANERQQEALIKAVTGRKQQVEIRQSRGEVKRLVGDAQVRADNRRRSPVVAQQQREVDRQRKAVKRAQEQLRTQQFYEKKADPSKGKTFLRRNPMAGIKTNTVVSKSRSLRDFSRRGDVRIIDPEKLPQRGVPVAARKELSENKRIVKSKTAPLRAQYRSQNRLKELGVIAGKSDRQKSAEKEVARRIKEGKKKPPTRELGKALVSPKTAADIGKTAVGLHPLAIAGKVVKAKLPDALKAAESVGRSALNDPTGIKRLRKVEGSDVVKVGKTAAKVGGAAALVGNAASNPMAAAQFAVGGATSPAGRKKTRRILGKLKRGETVRPSEIVSAGVPPAVSSGLKAAPGGAGNVAKTPVYVADVVAQQPGKQFDMFVKDMANMVKSIPAGVKSFADDPVRMVNETIKDYERRYGPLSKGDAKEFKARLKKEGVAPEVIDMFTVASGVGTVSGRGLGFLARRGALGGKLKSVATERNVLTFGGGEARTQAVSKNLFRAGAQRGVDNLRRRKLIREKRKEDARITEERTGSYTKSYEDPPLSPRVRQAIDYNKGGADLPDEPVTPLLKKGAKTTLRVPTKLNTALKAWAKGRKPASKAEAEFIKAVDEMPVGKTADLRLSLPATKVYSRLVVSKVDATPEIKAAARNVDANLYPAAQARKLAGMETADTAVPTLFDNRVIGAGRTLRKTVANIGSRAFVKIKVDQQAVKKVLNKELAAMSAREREAVFASIRYGITTPEQAAKWLPERRRQIVNNRRVYQEQNGKPFFGRYDELEVIDRLMGDLQNAFTPKVAEAQDVFRRTAQKTGRMNPAISGVQMTEREYGPMARLLGIKREDFQPKKIDANNFRRADGTYDAEGYARAIERENRRSTRAFQRAVDQRRREEGLARPGYFRDEKRPKDVFNQFTPGGSQAIAPDKKTKFLLEEQGRANPDPEVFVRGLMMNIKRAHNWNKVADVYDAVALPGYKNMTLSQIQDAVEKGRLDLTKIAFWNPRRFKRNLNDIQDSIAQAQATFERGVDGSGQRIPGDLSTDPDAIRLQNEIGVGFADNVDEALGYTRRRDGSLLPKTTYQPGSSVKSFDTFDEFERFVTELDGDYGMFDRSGWSVVPMAAHKEIMASTNPSGVAARVWDIAKGKSSRILLANPVWLQFQIASNAFLTGLSGGGVVSWYKAQRWWYKLTPEEKKAIAPYIGVHKWYDDQTHLGSQASRVPWVGGFIDTYRNFKEMPVYQRGLKNLNPLDALFKADNAQNNFFRRVVFYNEVKRAAYRDMGANAGFAMRAQRQIIDILKVSEPDEQMRAILKNQKLIEQHAKAVDDFLGNWLSYTNFERRYIGRAVMFYGFLRFSTKLTFYTMPVQHPITTSILLKIGQMQKEEVEHIFGKDAPVPPWEVGNWYSRDKKTRLELSRLNPFFNVYGPLLGQQQEVSLGRWDPANLLPMLPPMVVALTYDQLSKTEGGFAGTRPWTVNQGTGYVRDAKNKEGKSVGVRAQDRVQILVGKFLRQSPLYRELEKTGIPGVRDPLLGAQTSDSNLIWPNAKRYKQKDDIKFNKEKIDRQRKEAVQEFLSGFVTPLKGTAGEPVIKATEKFAEGTKKKGKKKAKKVRPAYGGGGEETSKGGPSFGSGGSGPSFK